MPAPKIYVNGKLENKTIKKAELPNNILEDYVLGQMAVVKTEIAELKKKIKEERKKHGK
jgi:hypothetical protein